jgi:hypothetical protein
MYYKNDYVRKVLFFRKSITHNFRAQNCGTSPFPNSVWLGHSVISIGRKLGNITFEQRPDTQSTFQFG